jgi:Protein of unknown function (DUF3808)
MKGNLDEALLWYKRSWKSQDIWTQFHHICFWEILWVNSMKLDWREGILFSSYLVENSRWSRTLYSYQKASLMCMLDPKGLTSSERRTLDQLFHDVPKYKQRIAGKSLPMEKFACRRAEKFFSADGFLLVPAIGESFELLSAIEFLTFLFLRRADVPLELVQNHRKEHSTRQRRVQSYRQKHECIGSGEPKRPNPKVRG